MKRFRKPAIIVTAGLALMLGFQNCGEFHPSENAGIDLDSIGNSVPTPPQIKILSRPKEFSNAAGTQIEFEVTGGSEINLVCSYNGGDAEPCASPIELSELEEGPHEVIITARDSQDRDATSVIQWAVDLTPAMVAISSGPNLVTEELMAVFNFDVTDIGEGLDKVECRLGDGDFEECESPLTIEDLPAGQLHRLEVRGTDLAGNEQIDFFEWRINFLANRNANGPILLEPTAIAGVNDVYGYFIDGRLGSLFRLDYATGLRTLISGPSLGTGPALDRPLSLAVNLALNQIYIMTRPIGTFGLDALVSVDIATGNRTTIMSDTGTVIGAGPNITATTGGMVMHPDGISVIVASITSAANGIYRVDLATGDRTAISDATVGAGDAFGSPRGISLRPMSNNLYVVDLGLDQVVRVDLLTGNRTTVSSAVVGVGPAFSSPRRIVVDSQELYLYVTDFSPFSVLRVNVATGDRTQIFGALVGNGASINTPNSVALKNDMELIVSDSVEGSFVHIDINNNNRTALSVSNLGGGPSWSSPSAIAIPANSDFGYVVDFGRSSLVRVELASGDRTVVSGPGVGVGPNLLFPRGVDINAAETEALVTLNGDFRVIRVDLATGDRSIVSDAATGVGPLSTGLRHIRYGAAETQAFVTVAGDEQALFSVDLANGNRSIITSRATVPALFLPRGVDYQDAATEVFFTDGSASPALYRTDLVNGNTTLVYTAAGSATPSFSDLAIDFVNGMAYVIDESAETLGRVNLADGTFAVVSSLAVGNGNPLIRPTSLAISGGFAYVFDVTAKSMIQIDLATGARRVSSK